MTEEAELFSPCPRCGRKFKTRGLTLHMATCGSPRSAELFWQKVEKTETCWLYRGFIKWDGYGWLARSGRYLTAHRYSWILKHGEPQKGMHILHKCDVPACCNPDHLFLGTHAENMADQKAKRRHVFGERGRSKLTLEQAQEIRRLYRKTGPRRGNGCELARRYGVTSGVIHAIVKGKTWTIPERAMVLHPGRVRPRKQLS